jgi:saccharopine dehydrogenase-like NADP-dependent oxidoreductase
MHKVMVVGSGKIGSLIACLFSECIDYQVYLADIDFQSVDAQRFLKKYPKTKTLLLDIKDQVNMVAYLKEHQINAIISSLPYFLSTFVAEAAKLASIHYFDLTEDTAITGVIKAMASEATSAFVPQCGLAPGFISIVANSLMKTFDTCLHAKLRVGALPQTSSHSLHYALTWSTDGLINEYGNPCHAIEAGVNTTLMPLANLETIEIDGCEYEAFNTSGGIGSLGEIYSGKIQTLNYKTIRYPGHCEKIRFLMSDLMLNDDRPMLKKILERALPRTSQDLVVIYVAVEGLVEGTLIEKSYVNKIYPKTLSGLEWSAIQVGTASSLCAVVDMVLANETQLHGLILQESFELQDVLANRFGQQLK